MGLGLTGSPSPLAPRGKQVYAGFVFHRSTEGMVQGDFIVIRHLEGDRRGRCTESVLPVEKPFTHCGLGLGSCVSWCFTRRLCDGSLRDLRLADLSAPEKICCRKI